MKKILVFLMITILTAGAALAQPGYGRPGYGPGMGRPGHGGYGRGHDRHGYYNNWYGGVKFGVVGSHITGGTDQFEANGIKSGISLGLATGFNISPLAAFESGLYYAEKGGIGKITGGKVTYDLHYLEVPLLLKVNIFSGNRAFFQPYAGAYLGLGVGGTNSFNDTNLKRGDSGLAIGCGVTWSFLHANIGYEYGLSDISKGGYGECHNRALILSVGFAF